MIGFRVDANEKIATGHLMRCLSIAKMCRQAGKECLFYLAEEKETERIKQAGFSYRILKSDWSDMETELPAMLAILKESRPDWLVVDSYQATKAYLKRLNREVPVLYIDDMGSEIYPVSAVLHYGIAADDVSYLEKYQSLGVKVLMGLSYVPLRDEFSVVPDRLPEREKSILITTGGTDPFRIADKLLERCLSESEETSFLREFRFEVIAGALNQHISELKTLAERDSRIRLHQNVSNMSDYMRKCMMAVSAGGTTLYELCACGIPTVCFSFADNQKPGTAAFGKKRLMDYAGDAREADVITEMVHAMRRLYEDKNRYENRQKKMQEAVDGRGAVRIAAFLTD